MTTVRTWPLVTWIMPVRNGMPFISKTLESIAAQTYPHHRIVVWDNGSTDGTQDELRRWIPERIAGELFLDAPLPLGPSRAALVERAQTELIACIDADDLNRPMRLEQQVKRMLEAPCVVALGTVPDIIDDADGALDDWVYPVEDAEIRWRTHWQTSLNASAVMFRRGEVLAAGNYRDIFSEDLDLWMRLARRGRMENLAERLILYRRHKRNITAGVLSYYDTDRQVAAFNATDIFPHVAPKRAIELWEAAYPRYAEMTAYRHLDMLRFAARDAARAVGEGDAYFINTRYYALQRKFMRRNILMSMLGLKSATLERIHAFKIRYRPRFRIL